MAHTSFAILIVAWIVFRLYYILVLPIRSAAFEARKIIDQQGMLGLPDECSACLPHLAFRCGAQLVRGAGLHHHVGDHLCHANLLVCAGTRTELIVKWRACTHTLAAQIVQVAVRALGDPSSTADVREEDNWNKEEDEKKKKKVA